MPTYEYECQSCHERVEAVQRFTDPALTVCAHCGGNLRKVFTAVGVVFKGSGFYKTDSRSSKSSSTTASTSKESSSTNGDSASSSSSGDSGSSSSSSESTSSSSDSKGSSSSESS